MSDYLTREFRTQVTTTMDTVLRRTVFEIMKIFENSLHDHQMELAQKGEEIVQLKIKLQTAEIKLRDSDRAGDRGAAMNSTQMNETQKEPEDVLNATGQTSDVPEIDFEVPDDWCAPLGCETVTKQEVNVCPSIRLRPLYIPLWHVPIIKQEVVNCDIDSHQRTKSFRRSKRRTSLKGHTEDRSLPVPDQGTRRPTVRRNNMKMLQDIKQEYSDLSGGPTGLTKGGRLLRGKEQENTLKSKGEESKIAATESKSTVQATVGKYGAKRYSCKFCKKVFDTEFGRSVHVRSHKRCRGCKREFPFPSSLRCHKPFCGKLKKLLEKKAQPTNPPKPQPCDEEEPTSPSKKQVINKQESTPSSGNHNRSSIQKGGSTKKYSCAHCNKKCPSRCRLKEHMRVHTGEKPFPCSMCSKKFRVNQSLKLHMTRIHQNQGSSRETNGGPAWTELLEVTEENREGLISPSKDTSQAVNHNNVQSECNPDKRKSSRWQTMGTRCANGFICQLCPKLMRNKYMLIEHFRTHTGETPLKCDRCPAMFRSRGQLSLHRKMCRDNIIHCEKCEKKFTTQIRYNKHMSKYHRDWPNSCKVCGKGFITKGRLRNHVERCHK